MNKLLIILAIVFSCGEAAAKCSYSGGSRSQNLRLHPKISLDPSIPVGTILHSRKFGTNSYRSFDCGHMPDPGGDQYIVASTGALVPGVTGVFGGPVYETGVPGIGYQVTDMNLSKNRGLVPATVGIWPVPQSTNHYGFIYVYLIKTGPIEPDLNKSINPVISFSAGHPIYNPVANDQLLYNAKIIFGDRTSFHQKSCDISVAGPGLITLNRVSIANLMAVARGGNVAPKPIKMNITCPQESIGGKMEYWFNPLGVASTTDDGVIENMIPTPSGARNVGVILKQNNTPVVFFDTDLYGFNTLQSSQSIDFTADYYRNSNTASDLSEGQVKAMVEVVIQEVG